MDHLLTEARNAASSDLDHLSSLDLVRLMNAEDARVIPAVAAEAERIAQAIELIAERFRRGGRLVYAGAGTSGRLGVLDASECPPTFNSPPMQVVGVIAGGHKALTTAVEGAEDHPEFAAGDLAAINLNANDALVGIATSGRTPFVLGALRHARQVGAIPIGFTCVPNSELAPLCDIVIAPLVGPEILTGSTRLKAGTATKLVLNMLTTGAMVRIGKTYGNLMVDLRATNTKLKARTNGIVRHFTGLSTEAARELLQRCDEELKTAIVAQRLGVSAVEARQRLNAAGGSIHTAIQTEPVALATGECAGLILGVDGGGSHTTALLARLRGKDCDIIGKGTNGPSNLRTVGESAALHALDEAIAGAFRAARLQRVAVESVVFGLAGAGREVENTLIKNWAFHRDIARRVEVVSDSSLLLALLPEQWGIAVVAGTGSGVWGRAPDGRTARAGGWGPLLGDEGSGYQMTLSAMRAALQAHDGRGEPTILGSLLSERMGLRSPEEIIPAIHGGGWDRARIAGLIEVVFQAQARNDKVAGAIIAGAAEELVRQVVAVARSLAFMNETVHHAFSGGLFKNHGTYQELVVAGLSNQGGCLQLSPAQIHLIDEPAEGALRIAAGSVFAIM